MKLNYTTILLVVIICSLSYSVPAAAEPTLKCEQYWGCTIEEALTDEFIEQLKQEEILSESPLKLTNVSNADLQKLPVLKDKLVGLKIERSKKVMDLAPISELIGLKTLQLDLLDNLIELAPIAKLNNLTKLYIKQVPFTSYEFLQPLNELEELIFALPPTEPSDISALAGKTKLKRLELGNFNVAVNINEIAPLKDSTQLEELVLYGIAAQDLSPLRAMKNLKRLILRGVSAKDLIPVGELTELIELDISDTNFADYSVLATCTKLEKLEARASGFKTLELIKNMPNLKTLGLARTPVKQWDALKTTKKLEFLAVGETGFRDLSLLSELETLRILDLSKNTVVNSETISTLPNLVTLGIKGTQGIKDVTIFKTLPQLKTLIMDKEQFPQAQIDTLKAEQPGLNISYY